MRRKGIAGFTLVELMLAVIVLAVLTAVALPSFKSTMRANRISGMTNELVSSLSLARMEAMRRPHGVSVCASSDGDNCGTDWATGWLIWSDENADGNVGAGESVIRYVQPEAHVAVSSRANGFSFDKRGRLIGGRQQVMVEPDECSGGEGLAREITILPTGQVRTLKVDCR